MKLVGAWQIGEKNVITIPDYPFDPSRGGIEEHVYIDHSDFRMQDSEDYYGLGMLELRRVFMINYSISLLHICMVESHSVYDFPVYFCVFIQ